MPINETYYNFLFEIHKRIGLLDYDHDYIPCILNLVKLIYEDSLRNEDIKEI